MPCDGNEYVVNPHHHIVVLYTFALRRRRRHVRSKKVSLPTVVKEDTSTQKHKIWLRSHLCRSNSIFFTRQTEKWWIRMCMTFVFFAVLSNFWWYHTIPFTESIENIYTFKRNQTTILTGAQEFQGWIIWLIFNDDYNDPNGICASAPLFFFFVFTVNSIELYSNFNWLD